MQDDIKYVWTNELISIARKSLLNHKIQQKSTMGEYI